ncbi:prepilin-type N-terminal cleavage/methylation domain-containing protein [Candidatus Daviesbacteria bacterium]|nr:prepilin-type N-terminal cleavage/methylation domain-containing protein [Candidatus Daviesbacteria bacterium]
MKKSAQVHKGFTLVELLVVIAIIAILAAVVVLIINPLELTRRGRDAARLTDLANLQQAINVAVQEATDSAEVILCSQGGPTCVGRTTESSPRASDGTGWVKVDLSAQQSVSVPTLPVDPVNSAAYHYTYCSDGEAWEINTDLESAQQTAAGNDKREEDGGDDTALYEVGSKLDLIKTSGGTCTYAP